METNALTKTKRYGNDNDQIILINVLRVLIGAARNLSAIFIGHRENNL
jgi:hypothetical protein